MHLQGLQAAGATAFQEAMTQHFLSPRPSAAPRADDITEQEAAEAGAEGQREAAADLLCTLGRLEACSAPTRLAILRFLTVHALIDPTSAGTMQQVQSLCPA